MNTLLGILAALALGTSLSGQQTVSATEAGFVASVGELTGNCLVRAGETATPTRLREGDRLRAGQEVSCARDSTLKIRFELTGADKPIGHKFPKWYTVPNPVPGRTDPQPTTENSRASRIAKNSETEEERRSQVTENSRASRIAKNSETEKERRSQEATAAAPTSEASKGTATQPKKRNDEAARIARDSETEKDRRSQEATAALPGYKKAAGDGARDRERADREIVNIEIAELTRGYLMVYRAQHSFFFPLPETFDKLENDVVSSYDNRDKARLDLLTAPNFYHVSSDGKSTNKKEWLDWLADLPGIYVSLSSINVTPLQSDSVIVTYNALVLTETDGKDAFANIGVTSAWVFDGKTWLIAFRQESRR